MPWIFESREVPDHAEHYPATDLIVGETYYKVFFHEPDLLTPYLEPLVFIGRDLGVGDNGYLYFQDLESYTEGARFGVPTDLDPMFERFDAKQTSGVRDFDRALNELLACWRRRRERP